jgi:N-acetylglucosaminyldiphosphoundecaprenol N-acetyl-beta-D-mannosaminyltransferase
VGETVEILGVYVHRLTREGLLQCVVGAIEAGQPLWVLYANAHVLNTAYTDAELRCILNRADVVYCDGAGVKWAARLLGHYLPERMTGADWIHDLCRLCVEKQYRLYLLGGEPGTADVAAQALVQQYPALAIVGTQHGFLHDDSAVIARVDSARPHILLVGFGTPLQERWIARNLDSLDVPVIWAVGALMDYVAGSTPRAPRWLLDHDLEWLGRLGAEPGRLWRRYLVGNPLFLYRVLKQRLSR